MLDLPSLKELLRDCTGKLNETTASLLKITHLRPACVNFQAALTQHEKTLVAKNLVFFVGSYSPNDTLAPI